MTWLWLFFFFLTQLYLGLKANMNHHLQNLLMAEEELEVSPNNNTITYYSEQDGGRGKVLQP